MRASWHECQGSSRMAMLTGMVNIAVFAAFRNYLGVLLAEPGFQGGCRGCRMREGGKNGKKWRGSRQGCGNGWHGGGQKRQGWQHGWQTLPSLPQPSPEKGLSSEPTRTNTEERRKRRRHGGMERRGSDLAPNPLPSQGRGRRAKGRTNVLLASVSSAGGGRKRQRMRGRW